MSQILSELIVGKKESVTEEFLLLNPHTIPMISMLGFGTPATAVEHVWYEDEMFGSSTKLAKDLDDSATDVEVVDASIFRKDHIVMIGEEFVKVTAVDTSANKLTVERGYVGTEAGAATQGADVEVQYLEGFEGMDAVDARYKPRKRVSNVMQIFTDTVSISGTAQEVAQHGVIDEYTEEKDKIQSDLAVQLERAVINGVKIDDGGRVRKMQGIRNFIKTNVVDLAGADLTAEKISDAVQGIYEAGGFEGGAAGYEIVVGPKLKRVISGFDKHIVRVNQDENTRGTVVNYLTTDFGEFPVSINNNLKADEVLIIDKNRVEIKPLRNREWFHEYLGKKGDYIEGMVVGEYTLELHQEKAHARIIGAKA